MKIGILTFHQALNYGAVLQTYALQRYLKDQFPQTEVQVVDYRCPKLSGIYTLKEQKNLSALKKLVKTGHFFLKKLQFVRFVAGNIDVSPEPYYPETVETANATFDKFLVGSDQVWNPVLTDGDRNYLLAFARKEKRYSYAASIGLKALPDDEKVHYRMLLNDFRGLSVREKSAGDILAGLELPQKVFVHPDPALLLKREQWESLCRKCKGPDKEYVFVFAVEYSEKLIREAAEFAKKKGIEAIYVGPYKGKMPIKYIPIMSLPRLLTYFRDARYVMVNSFHGTVFSIIFHKDFYASTHYQDGRNSRIQNLLELTHLLHRTNPDTIDMQEDWEQVDAMIGQQRHSAHDYLEWVLNDED